MFGDFLRRGRAQVIEPFYCDGKLLSSLSLRLLPPGRGGAWALANENELSPLKIPRFS